jgi:hypothetical protein
MANLDMVLSVRCPVEGRMVDVRCCKYGCGMYRGNNDGVLHCAFGDDEEARP